MKRSNDYVSSHLDHTANIIASQKVWVVCIAAKHIHLPTIIATDATTLSSIIYATLTVFHQEQYLVRR